MQPRTTRSTDVHATEGYRSFRIRQVDRARLGQLIVEFIYYGEGYDFVVDIRRDEADEIVRLTQDEWAALALAGTKLKEIARHRLAS